MHGGDRNGVVSAALISVTALRGAPSSSSESSEMLDSPGLTLLGCLAASLRMTRGDVGRHCVPEISFLCVRRVCERGFVFTDSLWDFMGQLHAVDVATPCVVAVKPIGEGMFILLASLPLC